jgi:MtN3 and saliva related transmembrane protein
MSLTPLEYILIISTLLEFNPLFQAVKSIKNRSVKDVSLWTFLSIVTIGTLWLVYGISIGNVPLIIGNVIKLFTALSVVVIYFRYRSRNAGFKNLPLDNS